MINSRSEYVAKSVRYIDFKWNIVVEYSLNSVTVHAPEEIMSRASGALIDGVQSPPLLDSKFSGSTLWL